MDAEAQAKLERELRQDWEEPGRIERLDEMVQEYLMHRAGSLADQRVRNEADLLRLIHTYSRVELIRALIQDPKKFNVKDMKELFRSTLIVEQNDAAEAARSNGLLQALSAGFSDAERKAIEQGLTDEAKKRMRARLQLGSG